MGKLADLEAEVYVVEQYLKEKDITHVFELQVLREFYEIVRAILEFDSLSETVKNVGEFDNE